MHIYDKLNVIGDRNKVAAKLRTEHSVLLIHRAQERACKSHARLKLVARTHRQLARVHAHRLCGMREMLVLLYGNGKGQSHA